MSPCVVRFNGRSVALWAIVSLLAAAPSAPSADAADIGWRRPEGGTFSSAGSWFGGVVPGAGDIAHFGLSTPGPLGTVPPYTVSFTTLASNIRLLVEDDSVVFDLNGLVYETTNPAIAMALGTVAGKTGQLTVTDGIVTLPFQSDLEIASIAGGGGSLVVGAGGKVLGTMDLLVGLNGAGGLLINNNGDLIANDATIGVNSGSSGVATITGAGSSLLADQLIVGNSGAGTLSATASGRVDSASGIVGNNASITGAVTVNGTGSRWDNAGDITVGRLGNGTLSVTSGGRTDSASGVVGDLADSTGAANVDGAGSLWNITGQLSIGDDGDGTLNITAGGRVQDGNARVGVLVGGNGAVNVSGNGSQWINSGGLTISLFGPGALNITAGGYVENTGAQIGGFLTSGAATVDGAGTRWKNSGILSVGSQQGSHGTLEITGDGQVENTDGFLGAFESGVGEVTVSGANSQWINSGELIVGGEGQGALSVTAGGTVRSGNSTLGDVNAGDGTVTVDGSNSQWINTGDLTIGNLGQGSLNILNGGGVQNANGTVGRTGLFAAVVNVIGAGSRWINSGDLVVTRQVTATQGGLVQSVNGLIGSGNNFSTATVTISGPNSRWSLSGELSLGISGALTIEAGGKVEDTDAFVGFAIDVPSSALVTGANSRWINSGKLVIGQEGVGTLQIANGGRVQNADGLLGALRLNGTFAAHGTVTVDGIGSQWVNSGVLTVGDLGKGTLNIDNGGQVQSGSGVVGNVYSDPFNDGSKVHVNGAGSSWVNTGPLLLGVQGDAGLTVTGGGAVTNLDVHIAQTIGSIGAATVAGGGSSWTINGRLFIGGSEASDGGIGGLFIQTGGTVHVAQDIRLFADDFLRLEGGTLSTTEIQFTGGGTFDWTSGTLHLGAYRGELTTPDDGILAPGNSVGQTVIDGNYFQTSGGTLEIEIGGPASADLVDITGVAVLSGNLQLKLLGGFVPSPASSFVVFDSRGINGAFLNAANGQRIATTDGLGSFVVSYGASSSFNPNQVVLSNFLATGLPGDYNQNGTVDAADYTVWRNNLGSGTALANDDTPGVAADDYTRWKTNFGQTAGSGSGGRATGAVPEPAAAAIFLAGVVGILMRRRAVAPLLA